MLLFWILAELTAGSGYLFAQQSSITLSSEPLLICRDQSGNFYFIDAKTLEIVQSSPEGAEIKRVSGFGTAASSLQEPVDIVFKGVSLYILDRAARSVKIYDRLLNFRSELKLDAAREGMQFPSPVSLSVDGFGNIWVCDNKTNTLAGFDRNFNFLRKADPTTVPVISFIHPEKVTADENIIAVRTQDDLVLFDHFLEFDSAVRISGETNHQISNGRIYSLTDTTVISRGIREIEQTNIEISLPQGKIPDSFHILNKTVYLIYGSKIVIQEIK